jgi:hypothetical protein
MGTIETTGRRHKTMWRDHFKEIMTGSRRQLVAGVRGACPVSMGTNLILPPTIGVRGSKMPIPIKFDVSVYTSVLSRVLYSKTSAGH